MGGLPHGSQIWGRQRPKQTDPNRASPFYINWSAVSGSGELGDDRDGHNVRLS